jgi:hypothetical protein
MAKKPILNEADVLARMAGGFQERPAKIAETITGIPEEPKKKRRK